MSARASLTLFTGTSRIVNLFKVNLQNGKFAAHTPLPTNVLWRSYSTAKPTEPQPIPQQQDGQAKVPETKEGTPPATNASGSELSEDAKKLAQELETLTNKVKKLEEKNAELTDKYKRSLAESENIRTRLTKQIADAKVFGIQKFCKDLLEVADTLGHATAAVPQEELNGKNPHLDSLYQGLTMTKASLLQVFKRHGLEPMDPLNQKFDPNFHEALFQIEDPKVEPNTIINVTKLGYKLNERCIRPALVGVSKAS